jgi:uncharacterized membrane protein
MKFPTEATLRRAIVFLSVIGLGVATYIAVVEGSGGTPACVAGGGGCETVAKSSYSHIAGINIAVFGMIGYVLLFISAFFRNDLARLGGFAVALGGFGFSVYLTYLELYVINAICQWCVASAILMTIIFILSALRLIGYAGAEQPDPGGGGSANLDDDDEIGSGPEPAATTQEER